MVLVSTSDALIEVADSILNQLTDLEKLEYNKKGRKYRFVNNNFQRIREEDKHLIINPEKLDDYLSVVSAYYILRSIGGELFEKYSDFCLSVIGVARELEVNGWYEEGSSVTTAAYAKYNPIEMKEEAMDFFTKVTDTHITQGLNLLVISKLNFLHTDHHIGTKLEGYYMSQFISDYYGEDSLLCHDILVALKSFVHWGNIKGILYKLEVPNINTDEALIKSFEKFPDPLEDFKVHVYNRYPLGTSKYSLLRKSIDVLADSNFSKLVPYPPTSAANTSSLTPPTSPSESYTKIDESYFDLEWLYQLCHDIEKNPIKYHLRSGVKSLSAEEPVNLSELSNTYSAHIDTILAFISLYMNIFEDTGGNFLLQHSKIPKFNDKLIEKYRSMYDSLEGVSEKVKSYKEKNWDDEDIVLRLESEVNTPSLYDSVMRMRELFKDDYE